jgi:hypothetical protein
MFAAWCAAITSGVLVATQSAPPTLLASSWIALSFALAVWATARYGIAEKRRRRWDAGDYGEG